MTRMRSLSLCCPVSVSTLGFSILRTRTVGINVTVKSGTSCFAPEVVGAAFGLLTSCRRSPVMICTF